MFSFNSALGATLLRQAGIDLDWLPVMPQAAI
jgi:hypothetical protein